MGTIGKIFLFNLCIIGCMQLSISILASSAIFLATGCSQPTPPATFEPTALTVPAGAESSGPRITEGMRDDVVLSWMEPDETGTTLKFSVLSNGQWQPAQSVVSGINMFVNWADLPSVVPLQDQHLIAHWLQKMPGGTYAYDVVAAQSIDNGRTWSESFSPHRDGTPTEHGFVSMFGRDDRPGMIWLDGRKAISEATDDPVASGMTLRAAFIDSDNELHGEQLVDDLICDCCQTDVAVAASGPVAVYRNRTVDEIRDIYVSRFVDGEWQPGQALANDNWHIAGCPVNGPAIVARGELVVVAWFSAANGLPVVRLKVSTDSGENFADAVDIAAGSTLGRVGVALLDDDAVAVSWLQAGDPPLNNVNVRRVGADGLTGPVQTVSSTAAPYSVPQMVNDGTHLVFAWTEIHDDVRRVMSARIPISSLSLSD